MSPLGQLDASPRGPVLAVQGANTQATSGASGTGSTSSTNPDQQYRSLQNQLCILNDTAAKEEVRLKAAQELSDNLDVAIASPHYQQFLDCGLRVFLKVLKELPNHSIAEYRCVSLSLRLRRILKSRIINHSSSLTFIVSVYLTAINKREN